MKNRILKLICLGIFVSFNCFWAIPAHAQMRVGAGKVDITPDPKNIPEPYTSIHDPIFTRAILVQNGAASALLVNLDVGNIPSGFTEKVEAEITAQYGIPAENMIVSAVHIHSSAGSLGGGPQGSQAAPSAKMQAFVDKAHQGILEAVKQAHDSLQPAEMGFGEGKLYLNVNRDAIDPATRRWAQQANT